MREHVVELQSTLTVEPATAWARATSLAGIASELPWPLRISTTPEVTSVEEFLAAGSVLGTLRVGKVPVLRWHPGIAEIGERHFVEASTDMSFMCSWRHERTISNAPGGGSIVHDRVTFATSMPLAAPLV